MSSNMLVSDFNFGKCNMHVHILRDFDLSPLLVGSMFVLSGGCYGKSRQFKLLL